MVNSSLGILQRDARATLEAAKLRQLRYEVASSPTSEPEEMIPSVENDPGPVELLVETPSTPSAGRFSTLAETPSTPSAGRFSTLAETIRNRRLSLPFSVKKKESSPWKDPQPFEVLRAVENRDLMFIAEVRDRAFHVQCTSLYNASLGSYLYSCSSGKQGTLLLSCMQ